jgi:adenylate cyclase
MRNSDGTFLQGRRIPDSWPCHIFLAIAYSFNDQTAAAHQAYTEIKSGFPFKSVAEYREQSDFQPGQQSDLINAGLARLGLPLE